VSNRSRGGRPSSLNVLQFIGDQIEVTTYIWSRDSRSFVAGAKKCFTR
jgi:hypothetical protein